MWTCVGSLQCRVLQCCVKFDVRSRNEPKTFSVKLVPSVVADEPGNLVHHERGTVYTLSAVDFSVSPRFGLGFASLYCRTKRGWFALMG